MCLLSKLRAWILERIPVCSGCGMIAPGNQWAYSHGWYWRTSHDGTPCWVCDCCRSQEACA